MLEMTNNCLEFKRMMAIHPTGSSIKAILFRGRMCVLEELSHHFLHSHPFVHEPEKKWGCRFVL